MNNLHNITICVSESIANWILANSREDIELALEMGRPIVCRIKDQVSNQMKDLTDKIQTDNLTTNIATNLQTTNLATNLQTTNIAMCIGDTLPTYKGQIGEAFVESILKKRFGSEGITNVAKVSKSGDLTLFIQHRKIIVEVKNYTNAVPTSGVEKFQRDLSTTNACGGLFVSLKTPITGVTSDFTIRYESADTKTVPCAYLVTSDESTICIAVNMIAGLIQSFDYLNAELYTKDKVVSCVYDISERLEEISRVRNDLQVSMGFVNSQLIKTTTGLVAAEVGIRRVVDSIRSELFYVQSPDVGPALQALDKNVIYNRYSIELKSCIAGVMKCIQTTLHGTDINGSAWKLSAKKCISSTGLGFNLLSGRAEVVIPRSRITAIEAVINAVNTFGKKVSLVDSLQIELDPLTYDWICKYIRDDFTRNTNPTSLVV